MPAYLNPATTSRFHTALADARSELNSLDNPDRISFPLGTLEEAAAHFAAREEFGYTYGRTGTPAGGVLERFLTTLEGGSAAVAVASGQAANFLVLNALLPKSGDEIIASSRVFGGTSSLLSNWLPSIGRLARCADPAVPESFEKQVTENTRAIFVETISNPDGTVADLEALAAIAQKHNIPLVVDNTLATPLLSRPIEWGANIVTSSLTKFFNGKGDLLAGAVIDAGNFNWKNDGRWPALSNARPNGIASLADAFNDKAFAAIVRQNLTLFGPSLNPADVAKLIDNAANLDKRLERHIDNANQVAEYLIRHPSVEWVHYAGLDHHPSHQAALKYLESPAALLLFKPKGDDGIAGRLIQSFRHIRHEANIGFEETLVIHPFDTTHRLFSPEQKEAAKIERGALRLSIGTENPQMIINDLNRAFTLG